MARKRYTEDQIIAVLNGAGDRGEGRGPARYFRQ